MLWQSMTQYLKSWFNYPGLEGKMIPVSIGLALIFGAVWLLTVWPPLAKRPWLWLAGIVGAFLTVLAGAFVQTPLHYYYVKLMTHFWSSNTLNNQILLVNIPVVLIIGLVQEGAKMVPIAYWWLASGKKMTPRTGLIVGAMAGAGFGIFGAVFAHNQAFIAHWTWGEFHRNAWQALLPFWSTFWWVAAHTGISALAGYGLARGKGWQSYLGVSVLHAAMLYFTVLYSRYPNTFNENRVEILLAGITALVMLAVIYLRWGKDEAEFEPTLPQTPAEPPAVDTPAQ